MKNREKYKEQIMEINISFCEDFIKPVILQALGMDCNDVSCAKCWVIQSIWLEEEYQEPKKPEVDWSKVAVDTPVLVSLDGEHWFRRYFAEYDGRYVYAWEDGCTSWSAKNITSNNTMSFAYAKLAEEESEGCSNCKHLTAFEERRSCANCEDKSLWESN